MELKSLVATRIREARRNNNLTQSEAADLYGIAQTTWANWETGNVNVPLDVIDRIAKILDMPTEYFVVADYEYTVKAKVPKEPARRRKAA